jgi:hypothetical protein
MKRRRYNQNTTEEVVEAEEAPLTVTSRGRQIRLPQRFRDPKKLAKYNLIAS